MFLKDFHIYSMTKNQMMKIFYPGYFLISRTYLDFLCFFFYFLLFHSRTFIYNENVLHIHNGAKLYIRKDSLSKNETFVLFTDMIGINRVEDIYSYSYIVKQNNGTFSDKMSSKRIVFNNIAKKLITDRIYPYLYIPPVFERFFSENILLPRSHAYFTGRTHFHNSAVFPDSNLDLKTAVLSVSYFEIFNSFSVKSLFEKKIKHKFHKLNSNP